MELPPECLEEALSVSDSRGNVQAAALKRELAALEEAAHSEKAARYAAEQEYSKLQKRLMEVEDAMEQER